MNPERRCSTRSRIRRTDVEEVHVLVLVIDAVVTGDHLERRDDERATHSMLPITGAAPAVALQRRFFERRHARPQRSPRGSAARGLQRCTVFVAQTGTFGL